MKKVYESPVFGMLRTHFTALAALVAVVIALGGNWTFGQNAQAAPRPAANVAALPPADPAPEQPNAPVKKAGKQLSGKLNLNTATVDQLQLLPSVGPAKAERIVDWRKKNGGFKRVADLRRVKGFGYKTLKKLEPHLDIKGDTTLAVQ